MVLDSLYLLWLCVHAFILLYLCIECLEGGQRECFSPLDGSKLNSQTNFVLSWYPRIVNIHVSFSVKRIQKVFVLNRVPLNTCYIVRPHKS